MTVDAAVGVRGTSGVVVGGSGRTQRWLRNFGWRHLVAWLALAFAVFPVLWILSASFNPVGTLV